MKKLLLALAVVAAAPAALADIWINPGFYSHHFDKSKNLNNSNTGFGVEATISSTYSLTAGVFENSNRATSHYVGAYVMPFKVGALKAGAAVGAFDGYPKMRNGGWFPAVVPTMAIEGRRVGLNISLIPKVSDNVNSAIAFQLKFNIAP
ncbi:hypothetical protein C5F52_26520 [Limnohabitans sp. TS-CS-82]|jgi:hypothetical protein|uniref:hypothetical protein n=1 Tax=Limnohabitans sp. TS-CS-82 TaxID=2094193 RepID=UPI000CF2C524|nr:hypothetical protein [Limnohabitans sp. TS-CS-82]PQA80155.1 hypothetical protein C5F52_26520 [Limnohabitans sp. TS-CS-82]